MRVEAASAGPPLAPPAVGASCHRTPVASPPGTDVLLDCVMAGLMRDAGGAADLAASRIRSASREISRARRRMLEQLHKQARSRRKGRAWRRFKRFLAGVAAVVGAAAALVSSPFTGGGSVVAYVGAALGVAAAGAGAASAAGGIAAGAHSRNAILHGLRSGEHSRAVEACRRQVSEASTRASELIEHVSGLEQKVIEIENREAALMTAAARGRTW